MSSTPAPAHQRAPRLSETELRQALDELDAKIKTLHNRVQATAAGSPNTYQQHAASLEAKRALLVQQLGSAPAPADGSEPSVWAQISNGITTLRDDLRNIL
jgi:hypothetical protein